MLLQRARGASYAPLMARKTRSGCKRTTIRFKTKRGKVVSFSGKSGPACGPRPKPKTGHLRPWKQVMAKAAPQCARKHGGGTKAFRKCVGQAVKSIHG